jgi:hypothetical protein
MRPGLLTPVSYCAFIHVSEPTRETPNNVGVGDGLAVEA